MERGSHLCLQAAAAAALTLVLAFIVVGCGGGEARPEYVARVNDQFLTSEEVEKALRSMPARLDSSDARNQVIEQWITNALLSEEASRRGLGNSEEVRRLLQESKRSIMASALLSVLYEEENAQPTPAELQSYFDRNVELFRLREPFVRVRHLSAADRDSALSARAAMMRLDASTSSDSLWRNVAQRFAEDEAASTYLGASHVALARLFSSDTELHEVVRRLRPGETSAVVATSDRFHVVQLVERAEPGSLPELAWVEEELRRRMVVQGRKQIYARQVQKLRNEALVRDDLEVR